MHTIKLLQQARDLFVSGKLHPERHNREELLSIKAGEWSYRHLLNYAEQLMEETANACNNSSLPEIPDEAVARQLLLLIREALYT